MDGASTTTDPMTEQDQTLGDADRPPDPQPAPDGPVELQAHRIVEAILFAADAPMPPAKVAAVLGVGDARDVRKHVTALNEEYDGLNLSFRIEEIAGGLQMLTRPAYNAWLTKLLRTRQETKLSPAALETLAITAYKQPCTRADVEAVRGVAAGDLLNRLREMNLVKIVGRAEDLGRPLLYGTTRRFLEVFGLPSLEDLPRVEALSPPPEEAPASTETATIDEPDKTEPADEPDAADESETAAAPDVEDSDVDARDAGRPHLAIADPDDDDPPDADAASDDNENDDAP
jgi:segregation and condensation protein B